MDDLEASDTNKPISRRQFLKFGGSLAGCALVPEDWLPNHENGQNFVPLGPWEDLAVNHAYPVQTIGRGQDSSSWTQINQFTIYGYCPNYRFNSGSGNIEKVEHAFALKSDASEVIGLAHVVGGLVEANYRNPQFGIKSALKGLGIGERQLVEAAIGGVKLREAAGVCERVAGKRYEDTSEVVDYNSEVEAALAQPDKYGVMHYLLKSINDPTYDSILTDYVEDFIENCRGLIKDGEKLDKVCEFVVDFFEKGRLSDRDGSDDSDGKLGEKLSDSQRKIMCRDVAAISALCLAELWKEETDLEVIWTTGHLSEDDASNHAWLEIFKKGKLERVVNPYPVDGWIFSAKTGEEAAMVMNNGRKIKVETRFNVSRELRKRGNEADKNSKGISGRLRDFRIN